VHSHDAAGARFAVSHRLKDLDSAAFSQNPDSAQVPAAVFSQTSPAARSQRPDERTDRRGPKRRNCSWGCKRIAEQIALAFGIDIDKDVVRRILATHFHPEAGSGGPSWLSFIGNAKDSLWSLDLFRCESAILQTYWVLVVMDQFTRRIVGFAVHRGVVDGLALCRMFNRVIHAQALPKYLSSDHDPLYRFHQWQANLRVLTVQEIKTVPYVPLSHPFVERLIGTIRREYLDQTLFWTTADLEQRLRLFQDYFNRQPVHSGLRGRLPEPGEAKAPLDFASYRWQQHCRGLSDSHCRVIFGNSPTTG
jgi:putative transposase